MDVTDTVRTGRCSPEFLSKILKFQVYIGGYGLLSATRIDVLNETHAWYVLGIIFHAGVNGGWGCLFRPPQRKAARCILLWNENYLTEGLYTVPSCNGFSPGRRSQDVVPHDGTGGRISKRPSDEICGSSTHPLPPDISEILTGLLCDKITKSIWVTIQVSAV
jgi:hypothetical protein